MLTKMRRTSIRMKFLLINKTCFFKPVCSYFPPTVIQPWYFSDLYILFPSPLIHIIHNRPAMSMWMKLLVSYMKPISGPVKMINVHQPDPRISPSWVTPFSPSHCAFFPKIIGLFQRLAFKGLIHVFVHFLLEYGEYSAKEPFWAVW